LCRYFSALATETQSKLQDMKKGFLPLSLLLASMLLTVTFMSSTTPSGGLSYTPRGSEFPGPDEYLSSLKANQRTGSINPADVNNARLGAALMGNYRQSQEELEWTSLGPDNFGGKTKAILFDNRDASANTIFAGSAGGGIFKTSNQGITWTHAGTTNLQASSMAQTSSGDIFVGTGDGFESQKYNVLADMGYVTGLMGQGIFKSTDGENFTLLESTKPETNNNLSGWAFVNSLAAYNNRLYAATNGGLRYSEDGGTSWSFVSDNQGNNLTANATDVNVGSDGTVVASVENKFYVSRDGSANGFVNVSTGEAPGLPVTGVTRLEVAIAPSDPSIMYAVQIDNLGVHLGIYRSGDKGETWEVIQPATNSQNMYQQRGNYNNVITVFPDNPNRIIVGGVNLWEGQRIVDGGLYAWDGISAGFSEFFDGYVHIGQQDLVFVPGQPNTFFVSTDGGIHKGVVNGNAYTFSLSNRNLISTQFYKIAPSGIENRVLGGAQDQGSIFISGTGNTIKQGSELWFQGGFSNTGHGGSCVISTINPNAIVLSATAGQMRRSEDMAFTFSTQFLGTNMGNTQAFNTPIALWESFTDQNSRDSVMFYARKDYAQGETLKVKSRNFDHPFYYDLPANMGLAKGDSILVKDIVASKLFIAVANRLFMTKEFLVFSKTPEWFELAGTSVGYSGIPQSLAYSKDANHVFVGMRNGKLFRVSNIALAYDFARADISSPECIIATKELVVNLPGTSTPITQAITSVYVDPTNANNVLITLANYGNDHYVFMSTNALSPNPTFTSKQGNLPKMPVYSSILEMSDPSKALIGTEYGLFMCDNIFSQTPNWYASQGEMGNVAVFDLKQQMINKPSDTVQLINVDTLVVTYPGTNNLGIVYAATFGRGLYRCNNFRKPVGTDETPASGKISANKISIYPNPVRDNTTITFVTETGQEVVYRIFDLNGRMIHSASLGSYPSGTQNVTIETADLSRGTYIISIESGKQVSTAKLIRY
jgi:hypothetical protein